MSVDDPELGTGVRSLVARVLKLEEPVALELRREDTDRWDSLKHAEIVFALEDAYNVHFDESEFAALDSTTSITAILKRHLGP